jgi:tRNA(Ile)-lysidine synthase
VHDRTLTVVERFERALGAILARVRVFRDTDEPLPAIAVAYSGGLDSSLLLHLLCDHVAGTEVRLFAFHVHHGLSPNADAWLAHCERQAVTLGVQFDVRCVQPDGRESGVEEAARLARYAALGELCRSHGVPLLLTAHHLDDQAETVLLQLLRGSGVAGLAGMEPVNAAPDLLGNDDVLVGRPLLDVARSDLEDLVALRHVAHIEDESNADTRYARNALRGHVTPVLAEYFPGFQERLARAAQHARSAQSLLDEVAASDLERCVDGDCIDLGQLRTMTRDRIDNLLRHWFLRHGLRMPSTAWLHELRVQILDADPDAQVCVDYPRTPHLQLRRYRDRLALVRATPLGTPPADAQAFAWNGEPSLAFPGFGGSLHFDSVDTFDSATSDEGIDAAWLRGQTLSLRSRTGGERLKLAPDRPSRTLKQHYQALGIPPWERARLPLLFAGDALLFAAGVGADCRLGSGDAQPKIRLRWQADIG